MRARFLAPFLFVGAFFACSTEATPKTDSPDPEPDASSSLPPAKPVEIELVESWPEGTSLDHDDIRDAATVWAEMIDRATTTIDFAEFYASADDGAKSKPESLEPVLTAVERATARGVVVRFLTDASFADIYPATLKRLKTASVDVREIDFGKLAGGELHAKYFVVDGAESFVGSQNFDWRALTQIQELGVRVTSPDIAGSLEDLFETDWVLAEAKANRSARVHNDHASPVTAASGEKLSLAASPKNWLPDESAWELPRIVSKIDAATKSVDVQVMTYSAVNSSGSDERAFTTLDDALRRAAERGVKVRLLVSHWGTEAGTSSRAALEALEKVKNVELQVLTVPAKPGVDIPYARVTHAKYAVFDGESAWVGTSNWEGVYFLQTRDVAVFVEGGPMPGRLDAFFESDWASPYTKPLAPSPAMAGQ